MSNFEIVLTVLACSVPFLALLFILPKFKKREKKQPEPLKTYEELKKEEVKQETKIEEPPKQKPKEVIFKNNDFAPDDFRSYLNHKHSTLSKPSRVDLPKDFVDRTEPYIPRRRRKKDLAPKSVAEEIRSLSPELKALIFTGALDKKNFD